MMSFEERDVIKAVLGDQSKSKMRATQDPKGSLSVKGSSASRHPEPTESKLSGSSQAGRQEILAGLISDSSEDENVQFSGTNSSRVAKNRAARRQSAPAEDSEDEEDEVWQESGSEHIGARGRKDFGHLDAAGAALPTRVSGTITKV